MNPRLTKANEPDRALRTLFLLLPKLHFSEGAFDTSAVSNDDLLALLAASDAVTEIMHRGVTTLGWMIALESADMEDGTLSASAMEACGWLIAELADTAATCSELAVLCRKQLGSAILRGQRLDSQRRAKRADSR